MTRGVPFALAAAGFALMVAGGCGGEQETLPAAVMEALNARFPGAEIQKWERETEDGVALYDIEFLREGRKGEADIGEDGAYLNFELEIPVTELPEAVRLTVAGRYPDATIRETMAVTSLRGGQEAFEGYEVVFVTAEDHEVELTIAPDGTVIEESGEEASEGT